MRNRSKTIIGSDADLTPLQRMIRHDVQWDAQPSIWPAVGLGLVLGVSAVVFWGLACLVDVIMNAS